MTAPEPSSPQVLAKLQNARATRTKVGSKTVETPGFMPMLRGKEDLDVLLEDELESDGFTGLVVPMHKAQEVVRYAERQEKEHIVHPGWTWSELMNEVPLLIDPVSELWYLKRPRLRSTLINLDGAPSRFFDHLADATTDTHGRAWREVLDFHRGDYAAAVEWLRKEQTRLGASTTLPLTPFIDGRSKQTLRLAVTANILAHQLVEPLGGRPGFYFSINYTVFKDSWVGTELLNELREWLPEYPPHLVAIRLRGLPGTEKDDDTPRVKNLADFLSTMGYLADEFGFPLVLFNGGTYGLPAIDHGFDAFSEPMNGNIGDIPDPNPDANIPKEHLYGRVYHPEHKINLSHSDYVGALAAEGAMPEVPGASPPSTDMNVHEFRRTGKRYRLAARAEEAHEVKEAILQQDARGLAREFKRSQARNVEKLLRNPL